MNVPALVNLAYAVAQLPEEPKQVDRALALIDRAIEHEGSYYLTYHRWATRKQILHCYPQFVEFLRLKRHHDRKRVFDSDWHRHYHDMFADRV